MKASIYAFPVRYASDRTYLYSTLYKTLVGLGPEAARLWAGGRYEELFDYPALQPCRDRFTVPDGVDEFYRALHHLLRPPGLPKTLFATVVVTMQCNLHCLYCHESGRLAARRMSRQTAEETTSFLRRQVARRDYRRIVLCFYGGEPLMNLDAIEVITRTLVRDARVPVSVMIPTNALPLDAWAVGRLAALGVDLLLQVTLDGPPEVHDARRGPPRPVVRPQAGGPEDQSLYHRVVQAVRLAAGPLRVVIRTNVDRANEDQVPILLDGLIASGLLPDRVRWYAFPVSKVIGGNPHTDAFAFTLDEWADAADRIWAEQLKRGIPLDASGLSDGLCGIRRTSTVTIDTSGGLHACTGLHSRARQAAGSVRDDEPSWSSMGPQDFNEECRHCAFFPYCGGGCRAQAVCPSQQGGCPASYFEKVLPRFLRHQYDLS